MGVEEEYSEATVYVMLRVPARHRVAQHWKSPLLLTSPQRWGGGRCGGSYRGTTVSQAPLSDCRTVYKQEEVDPGGPRHCKQPGPPWLVTRRWSSGPLVAVGRVEGGAGRLLPPTVNKSGMVLSLKNTEANDQFISHVVKYRADVTFELNRKLGTQAQIRAMSERWRISRKGLLKLYLKLWKHYRISKSKIKPCWKTSGLLSLIAWFICNWWSKTTRGLR